MGYREELQKTFDPSNFFHCSFCRAFVSLRNYSKSYKQILVIFLERWAGGPSNNSDILMGIWLHDSDPGIVEEFFDEMFWRIEMWFDFDRVLIVPVASWHGWGVNSPQCGEG